MQKNETQMKWKQEKLNYQPQKKLKLWSKIYPLKRYWSMWFYRRVLPNIKGTNNSFLILTFSGKRKRGKATHLIF